MGYIKRVLSFSTLCRLAKMHATKGPHTYESRRNKHPYTKETRYAAKLYKRFRAGVHRLRRGTNPKHQIEELVKKQEADRENNRKDHKEFYERLEFGEKAQAVTQNQLAQILDDTSEIKTDLKDSRKELTTAIEKQNQAITDLQMKPAHKWDMLGKEVLKLVIALVFGIVAAAIGLGAFK